MKANQEDALVLLASPSIEARKTEGGNSTKSSPGRLVARGYFGTVLRGILFVLLLTLLPTVVQAQGALTNGVRHLGDISIPQEVDEWTVDLQPGDFVWLKLGETDNGTGFQPSLGLYGPDDVLITSDTAPADASISHTALTNGTYTFRIVDHDTGAGDLNDDTGSYRLEMALIPGTFVVEAGDQGGALANGALHFGDIDVGDIDRWTVDLEAGDFVWLKLGETNNGTGFQPWLGLYGPDGTFIASDSETANASVSHVAETIGTYTFLILDADSGAGDQNDDTGSYRLELVRMPGAFTVDAGDEGGALGNGSAHFGDIDVGDIDRWTVDLEAGDFVWLKLGETNDGTGFQPWLGLYGPDGTFIASDTETANASLSHVVATNGTYTFLIEDGDGGAGDENDDTGSYRLELVRMPGAFTVEAGDEGGALGNGSVQYGDIEVGDVDRWTVDLEVGDFLWLKLGETNDGTGFQPWLGLYGPDGTLIASDSEASQASVSQVAGTNGTYTFLVIDAKTGTGDENDDMGSYRLEMAHIPGSFAISPGDEGGTMTNAFQHTGTIHLGDLDVWNFQVCRASFISLICEETGSPGTFTPRLHLYSPNGSLVTSAQHDTLAAIYYQPTNSGVFVLIVDSAGLENVGDYRLTGTGLLEPGLRLCNPLVVSGTILDIAGVGGPPGTNGVLYTTTNLNPPVVWSPLSTNQFDSSGFFQYANTFDPAEPERYFQLEQQ